MPSPGGFCRAGALPPAIENRAGAFSGPCQYSVLAMISSCSAGTRRVK